MVMYVVLGCLMDALAMVILTVPIIFPVIKELGFDPIWFGVIIVMTVELGLIHPPVGMVVFVIKSVIQDINFSTIFADGDYVIVHVHAVREPGTRGNAIVDIFKLENGKVVEHWDVIQPIPEKAANDNGMF
jgi:hypothetical protein